MNLAKLDEAIKKVCPIFGVCSDGRIDFKDEATDKQKSAAKDIFDNWVDTPDAKEITKLEFKKRLKAVGKYSEAKSILDSLPEDKAEDWELASCVTSDNADILAILQTLNINVTEIFY